MSANVKADKETAECAVNVLIVEDSEPSSVKHTSTTIPTNLPGRPSARSSRVVSDSSGHKSQEKTDRLKRHRLEVMCDCVVCLSLIYKLVLYFQILLLSCNFIEGTAPC